MTRPRTLGPRSIATLAACSLLVFACADGTAPTGDPLLAKNTGGGGSTSITVSSASPDTGSQGTTLDVTINGSGFTSDMEATWLLDGVARPEQVITNSTSYVSSKKLVANVTIAPDATVDRWDIGVMSKGTGKGGIGTEVFAVVLRHAPGQNPTTTWYVPLGDTLSLQSDGRYLQGQHSVYANGVCGVEGLFHYSSNGHATMELKQVKGKNSCRRAVTIVRAPTDTTAERRYELSNFNNLTRLHGLDQPDSLIALGETVPRRFLVGQFALCGRLVFGENIDVAGTLIAPGSHPLLVTRVSASTFEVRSQPAPHNLAMCETTGELWPMRLRFIVESSLDLPT